MSASYDYIYFVLFQKLALSAGYFFKCPLCNDKNKFVEEMQANGIYVPER